MLRVGISERFQRNSIAYEFNSAGHKKTGEKTNNATPNCETSGCLTETIMGWFVADPLIPSAAYEYHVITTLTRVLFSENCSRYLACSCSAGTERVLHSMVEDR
jgi:hypothetical protein